MNKEEGETGRKRRGSEGGKAHARACMSSIDVVTHLREDSRENLDPILSLHENSNSAVGAECRRRPYERDPLFLGRDSQTL